MGEKLRYLSRCFVLSGILILLIGLYFSAVKAGIPYQDPTTQLQIQWRSYQLAGDLCCKVGLVLAGAGAVGEVVTRRMG